MNQQRMTKMLECARGALDAAGYGPGNTELMSSLILASAIEESGSSISMSLDNLTGIAVELGSIASSISNHS